MAILIAVVTALAILVTTNIRCPIFPHKLTGYLYLSNSLRVRNFYQEYNNDFAAFSKNHVTATWAFPNNLFVLTKDGQLYKVGLISKMARIHLICYFYIQQQKELLPDVRF